MSTKRHTAYGPPPPVLTRKPEAVAELEGLRGEELMSIARRLGRLSKWRWDRCFTAALLLLLGGLIGGGFSLIPFLSTTPGPTTKAEIIYFGSMGVALLLAGGCALASLAIKSEREDSVSAIKEDLDQLLQAYGLEDTPLLARSESASEKDQESAPEERSVARLQALQQELPTLEEAVRMAYGEKAIREARGRMLNWCMDVERELLIEDEDLWARFRAIPVPGISDRTAVGEGVDPDMARRQWDRTDSTALFGLIHRKAEALGDAIAVLEERHAALPSAGSAPSPDVDPDRGEQGLYK